eukprot:422432-Pleurochrysis_carterae.AAC.2
MQVGMNCTAFASFEIRPCRNASSSPPAPACTFGRFSRLGCLPAQGCHFRHRQKWRQGGVGTPCASGSRPRCSSCRDSRTRRHYADEACKTEILNVERGKR